MDLYRHGSGFHVIARFTYVLSQLDVISVSTRASVCYGVTLNGRGTRERLEKDYLNEFLFFLADLKLISDVTSADARFNLWNKGFI